MKTLADIPVGLVWQAQQAALMRLQLYLVLRTHEMLRGVLADCREALEAAGDSSTSAAASAQNDKQRVWDGLSTHLAIEGVSKAWAKGFGAWKKLFEGLRWEAGALPFGALAVLHDARDWRLEVGEGRARTAVDGVDDGWTRWTTGGRGGRRIETDAKVLCKRMTEAASPVQVQFEPQLQGILDAARERVYGDGFKLSQRIWRLDQESLNGIRQVVYEGIANGESAWAIARKLEQFLGAGAGCPRWARSRLYGLTKKDIASGDRMGLYSGEECKEQGVSYNALRLARNEVQISHHMATRAVQDKIPWIEQLQIYLSPAHPEVDKCDDAANGGPNGDGVYPKAEAPILPLHPQCLCGSKGILLGPEEFADKLRGWVRGEEQWPQMDQYAGWLGVGRQGIASVSLGQTLAGALLTWLWGGQDAMDAAAMRFLLPLEQLVFPN